MSTKRSILLIFTVISLTTYTTRSQKYIIINNITRTIPYAYTLTTLYGTTIPTIPQQISVSRPGLPLDKYAQVVKLYDRDKYYFLSNRAMSPISKNTIIAKYNFNMDNIVEV